MIEYRLVFGVLAILFDEDSASEAKRQFDLSSARSNASQLTSMFTLQSVRSTRRGEHKELVKSAR